jgi:beta-phosphoglucomutase-like phosphatase (HAD superfamily)
MEDRISAVIFDFDGTLVDTEFIYARFFLQMAKEFGIDRANGFECDDDVIGFYRYVMCGVRWENQNKMLAQIFPGFDVKKYETVYREKVGGFLHEWGTRQKPGVPEIFEYLMNRGIKVAIASMTRKEKIKQICETAGIDLSKIECIFGGLDITNAKPDPEIYIKCMEALGVTPAETVVVEDSSVGALAGLAAGCRTVVVRDFAPITPEVEEKAFAVLEKDCLIKLKTLL